MAWPPHSLLSVHLAESVMQHHIGRSRCVRAGVISDDGVEAKQRLDEIALEPVVEHFAGGHREQIEQHAPLLHRQPPQDVAGFKRVEDFAERVEADAFDDIGWRAQHELAQHVGDDFKLAVEAVDALRVARRQLRQRLMGAGLRR